MFYRSTASYSYTDEIYFRHLELASKYKKWAEVHYNSPTRDDNSVKILLRLAHTTEVLAACLYLYSIPIDGKVKVNITLDDLTRELSRHRKNFFDIKAVKGLLIEICDDINLPYFRGYDFARRRRFKTKAKVLIFPNSQQNTSGYVP